LLSGNNSVVECDLAKVEVAGSNPVSRSTFLYLYFLRALFKFFMSKMSSHILSIILRHLKSRDTFESVGIKQYRILLEKSAAVFKPDKSVRTESVIINGIEALWLIPENCDSHRIVFYIHGGGFVAGSILSHKDLASRVAKACRAKTLLFNYRLAPEHPFPAGLTDVRNIYEQVWEKYGRNSSISIVGDSAGGGLALSLLSELIKSPHMLPAATVLLSPWIDLNGQHKSYIENKEKDPMLKSDMLKKIAALYADEDLSNPLVSPIHNDFTGTTPVLIQVGENEILLDDSKILAQKLKSCGAISELEIWPDMFHVWHYFARYLTEGREAIEQIGTFVRRFS
jgi:epsilon-lactone hydrolase